MNKKDIIKRLQELKRYDIGITRDERSYYGEKLYHDECSWGDWLMYDSIECLIKELTESDKNDEVKDE
ncbi:MAG: hypothetical protein GY804_11605 [Alphaproteobacteria bacterium]|nr:hypothetical protein [Alphaproteobacteria bacterium]